MRVGDNTVRNGRGYTKQEGAEGGGSPTIQRGTAEAIQNKKAHREEDRRQYREEEQRLYKTRWRTGWMIAYSSKERQRL